MRLKITKSKNKIHYSIIKDFTNLYGNRTTKLFKKLGNQQQVEKRFGTKDTLNKIKVYVLFLDNKDKEEIIKKEFNPNKRISSNSKRKFNVDYLFLEKLYY